MFPGTCNYPPPPPPQGGQNEEVTSEIPQRNVENAVYNELTDSWMIPQADPYTLENFQQAYDNLASGKSLQTLTRAEAEEFSEPVQLEPTHYALKIYPKSEEEQFRVEMMNDVQTLPIPFGYTPSTKEESERAEITGSKENTIERSPYTVTYDYTEVTDGGPTGPRTFQLPILYAVWPASKPLPEDLEYEMVYELFYPHTLSEPLLDAESTHILTREATAMASGKPLSALSPATRAGGNVTLRGTIQTYDHALRRNVPISNLKIAGYSGSIYVDTITDESGYFSVTVPANPESDYHWIFCYFEDPQGRWKIVVPGTTFTNFEWFAFERAPGATTIDADIILGPVVQNGLTFQLNDDLTQEANIHRAVNYFFNGQNVFPKAFPNAYYQPSQGLRIEAKDYSSSSLAGLFAPNPNVRYDLNGSVINVTFSPSIMIYNNGASNNDVIRTTLHELGHAIHCYNDILSYLDTNSFLKESFASYVGWYLVQEYYESLGWVNPGGNPSLASNDARQSWTKTTDSTFGGRFNDGYYSPLFVDLTDNYNQKTSPTSSRPNDNLSGVPPQIIWYFISTSSNYSQVRQKIVAQVGRHPDFDEWIQNFDDSPVNN